MGNKPTSSTDNVDLVFDESELLIHGFLRQTHHKPLPNDICQLCSQFYTIPKQIFICNYAGFHVLDATSPNKIQFNPNIIALNSYNSSQQYFDICCHIPNISNSIPASKLNQLLQTNSIKNNTKYDAILTRKLSHISPQTPYNFMFVYESNFSKTKSITNTVGHNYFVLQSSNTNTHLLFDDWFYCGPKWGIIACMNQHIFSLKLQDIDTQLTFTPYRNKIWRHGKWTMQYLEGRETLFAVQLSSMTPPQNYTYICPFRFTMFDLRSSAWTEIEYIPIKSTNGQMHKFEWSLGHNGNESVFMVSSIGDVLQYNLHRNRWTYVHETNAFDGDFKFNTGPVVWCYDHCPDILYCAGGDDYCALQLMSLDMRRTRKQWSACLDHFNIDLPRFYGGKFNTFS